MPLLGLKLWQLAAGVAGLLAIIGAIFLAGHSAGVRAEQKRTDPKIAAICAAAGSSWIEVDKAGKPLVRRKWGKACKNDVAALSAFKGDALAGRQKVLSAWQDEQTKKLAADADAAVRSADALQAAKARMEQKNAATKDDRVGGSWFSALGELGGLREPAPPASAHGALRGPPGKPAR